MLRHRARMLVSAWGAALVETSPHILRRWLGWPSGLTIAIEEGGGLRIATGSGAGRSDICRGEMIPSEADVLRRTLTLPGNALAELDNLVRLDLPVSTPFDADDVVYATRIAGRTGKDWQAEVAILPRSALNAAMDRIRARFDAVPARVSFGAGLHCAADPARAKAVREARRLDLALSGLAAVLALLVLVLAQQQAEERARGLKAALSARMAEIDRASALEASIERYRAQSAFMAAESGSRRSARAMLSIVSASLDAQTRLDSMEWSSAGLTLLPRPGSPPIGEAAAKRMGDALFPDGYASEEDHGTRGLSLKPAARGER